MSNTGTEKRAVGRPAPVKALLASIGSITLTTAQFATFALAIFATIPLLFSLFLGVQFNTVLSGSMQPTFATSDIVVTRDALGGELQVGAIVGVTYGDTQYAHRVVEVQEDGTAITQGDANNQPDMFKPSEKDLWGVVIAVIPQPLASFVTLFTINLDWWGNAAQVVATGDWGKVGALQAGAPWGFFALVVAILLVWWIIPDVLAAIERRRERRAEKDLEEASDDDAESDDQIDIPLVSATVAGTTTN